MSDELVGLQGSLFTREFLKTAIVALPEWNGLDEDEHDKIRLDLIAIFERFPVTQAPNESQTEDDLIWPILERLGWNVYERASKKLLEAGT